MRWGYCDIPLCYPASPKPAVTDIPVATVKPKGEDELVVGHKAKFKKRYVSGLFVILLGVLWQI